MSNQTINLTPQLYEYMHKAFLREPNVLKNLRDQTHQLPNANMQISPEQGQFLALLVEVLGAKKTLDIGTFTGYSALVVALALPQDGKVYACDVSEEWTTMARKYWQDADVANKIDLRLAPAGETLQAFIDQGESGTFDFAFIDADKKNYDDYYEKSLKLLRKGGLMAIDNVLFGGRVADPANKEPIPRMFREFNQKLLNDERISLSMIPISDGLTLARKR